MTRLTMTLFLLALSASPAFADYVAWFAPQDYVGDFQPGDISDDLTEMTPPDGACGFRITDPSYYRWTDDYGNTVTSHDLYKDVIIWIDNPGDGCDRPFSVRYYDDSHTFDMPNGGAVAMEISTNYSAHWVGNDGYYLYTCNACVGATDFAIEPQDVWWPWLPAGAAFKAVGATLLDPQRNTAILAAIPALSREVARLQTTLQSRLTTRRRSLPLGHLEESARSLEDAAAKALADARKSVATCDTLARQGALVEASVACTTAGQRVERSRSLARSADTLGGAK